jgi:hypothetical protein
VGRLTVRSAVVFVIAIASILAAGCDLIAHDSTPTDPLLPADNKGTLVLTLEPGILLGKTLAPPISMEIASFDIRGTGPDPVYDHFESLGNTAGLLSKSSLSPGLWTITADARNATATIIGNGQTDPPVLITAGAVTNAQITVAPLRGTGVLTLTVEWTKKAHPSASVQCSLISMSTGVELALVFTLIPQGDPFKATCTQDPVDAGYYLMLVRAYDAGVQFWGVTEAVRIVAGQTTSQIWTTN